MAITLDPATRVFSVPQADLTFVSGTLYEMDTETAFRQVINSLMDNEDYVWMPDPIIHNTDVTVAGVTYARFIEMINSYSVTFTPDSPWSVRLIGSNNNIFDIENGILNQNQVQVIPGNAAGLIVTNVGSGLDAGQDTKLTRIHALLDTIEGTYDHQEAMRIMLAVLAGKATGLDTNSPVYMAADDSKPRVAATTDDSGNRSSVTIDEV